ncbi:MAG TPA: molybdopterin-dependent oxidoreductase [Bryobacteraceae bacterium]|nr:molybdopterin-dependent oxidoreductase [Bryobacteraceae bacterium]
MRSPKPADLEMPLGGFGQWITPVDLFFVRCHTYTPERANLADWKLKLDGVVNQPLALTMDDLKHFPRVELVAVLECAGNGRAFYQPHVAGTQWEFGSVGNTRWAGVRLRDVLEKAGLKNSARELLLDGYDQPLGAMPKFQRTIPLAKAQDPDTLLVYEMNGQPLTIEHGFPLRLMAPGWAGDSWVKWLQHVEVLDHEFDGFWMKTAYRHPPRHVEPGAAVDPADMVPVTDLNVKSVIAAPATPMYPTTGFPFAGPGHVRISGAAWSNASPVTRVDVSIDGAWKRARLGKDQSRYGWRLWEFDWNAAREGRYVIMARATNGAGQTQPLEPAWNPSGYLWNAVQRIDVEVAKEGPHWAANDGALPLGPAAYQAACLTCHDAHMMVQQRLTRAQWDREVGKMTGWGARIKPEDREAILNYLSDHFRQ